MPIFNEKFLWPDKRLIKWSISNAVFNYIIDYYSILCLKELNFVIWQILTCSKLAGFVLVNVLQKDFKYLKSLTKYNWGCIFFITFGLYVYTYGTAKSTPHDGVHTTVQGFSQGVLTIIAAGYNSASQRRFMSKCVDMYGQKIGPMNIMIYISQC